MYARVSQSCCFQLFTVFARLTLEQYNLNPRFASDICFSSSLNSTENESVSERTLNR